MSTDVGNILTFTYNNDRIIKIRSEEIDVLRSQVRVVSIITGKTRFTTLTVCARRTLRLTLLLHGLSNGLLYYCTDTIDRSVV